MDFKVAGTKDGVTAIQLDIKLKQLTRAMIEQAIARGRDARLQILETMERAIAAPRDEVGEFAPKLLRTSIPQESIDR